MWLSSLVSSHSFGLSLLALRCAHAERIDTAREVNNTMKNRFAKLSAAIRRKSGLLVLVTALLLSLVVMNVSRNGLPFTGGSKADVNVTITDLTTQNFQQEISKAASGPMLVLLVNDGADSRAARIVLAEAGKPYVGKVSFFTVNVNTQPQIALMFQSMLLEVGIPVQKGIPAEALPVTVLFKINADTGAPEVMNVGASLMPSAAVSLFIENGLKPPTATGGAPSGTPSNAPSGTPSNAPSGTPSNTPSGTPAAPASPSPSSSATPASGL